VDTNTTSLCLNSLPGGSTSCQVRAEQTLEEAAVSLNEAGGQGYPVPFPVSASVVGQTLGVKGAKPTSKVKKLARRWVWLKFAGGYLDLMPYYFSEHEKDLRFRLENCQHTWLRERKGEDIRWRGIGCGEREVCPLCGSYRQLVLAREASESMSLAQTAVEVNGYKLDSYGLKLVLTIPKVESKRIDGLLGSDYPAWQGEVSRLFREAYAFVGRWFGDGCGGVVSLDYTGESAPSEAHYHINIYVWPARLVAGRSVSLGHWIDKAKLNDMRAGWTARVNEAFGLELKSANFKAFYLGSQGQLYHWMRYLYRHPLSDLWRGWRGVSGGHVKYKVGKVGKTMELSGDDMQGVANRLRSIPSHFKRVRWFGIFSDGQRSKTMACLGLERVEVEAQDEGDDDKWVQEGEPAQFVRYDDDGVVLRTGDGDTFKVLDSLVDYRPKNVSIGKRKRWRQPGS